MRKQINAYKAPEIASMLKCSVRKVQMLWEDGKLQFNVENGGHFARFSTLQQINAYTNEVYGNRCE